MPGLKSGPRGTKFDDFCEDDNISMTNSNPSPLTNITNPICSNLGGGFAATNFPSLNHLTAAYTPSVHANFGSNLTLNQLNQFGNYYHSYYSNFIANPTDSVATGQSLGSGAEQSAASVSSSSSSASNLLLGTNLNGNSNLFQYLNTEPKMEKKPF